MFDLLTGFYVLKCFGPDCAFGKTQLNQALSGLWGNVTLKNKRDNPTKITSHNVS